MHQAGKVSRDAEEIIIITCIVCMVHHIDGKILRVQGLLAG